MASKREVAQGEHAAAHLSGRTEMRREQVGGSVTNREEGSERHQGSNAVAEKEHDGGTGVAYPTHHHHPLSRFRCVPCTPLLLPSSAPLQLRFFLESSLFLYFLGSFQWMLYKNTIFALDNE